MIKNILFDLGGVLINLDQNKTLQAFEQLGLDLADVNLNSSLFTDFETGKCSSIFFIDEIRKKLPKASSDELIVNAWNAMLLDFPAFRMEILHELKNDYNLYLFSNTNSIHLEAVLKETDALFGKGKFESMFEAVFYSHTIGMRKPHVTAFDKVIQLANIKATETIFIDDSEANIEGAKGAGLHTILAKHPIQSNFVTALNQMLTSAPI